MEGLGLGIAIQGNVLIKGYCWMGRVKSLEEIKAMVRERTGKQGVFRRARSDDVESVLERLKDKDRDHWAAEWSRVAKQYDDEGARHELAGRGQEACAAYK